MDLENVVLDSDMAYPILFIPKKCTTLESNYEISDNVYINVNITSPDSEGNDTIIYNGFCNVKLVDSFNVSPNRDRSSPCSMNIDQMPVIFSETGQLDPPYNQSQVWIDPSRSPFVYNHCDSANQESHSIYESGGLITVEQHNTYITQNVYNCNESNVLKCKEALSPVKEVGWKRYRSVQESNRHSDASLNFYGEDEFECGVFLSQLPEEIMNETQSRIRDERKFSSQTENNALKQLMSSDIRSSSKQQKTILFIGHNSHSGQTIHNISFSDPEIQCAAVDNDVVIDDSTLTSKKKYQCDKCKKLFHEISSFRQHMITSKNKNAQSENEVSFMCVDCGKSLKDQRKFEIHCQGHGDPDLECTTCGKVLSSKISLRNHSKIHNRKYPCNYCAKSYATFNNLKMHLCKTHSLYMCDDENCAFVTGKVSDLDVHQHWNKEVADSASKDEDLDIIYTPDEELETILKTEDALFLNSDVVQETVYASSGTEIQKSPSKEESAEIPKSDSMKSTEELSPMSRSDSTISSDESSNEGFAVPSKVNSKKTASLNYNKEENIRKADSVIATVMSNSMFLMSSNKASHGGRKICEVCQKSFDRLDELKRHLIEHVIKSTLAKMPISASGHLYITCEVCQSEVFYKVDKYKAHLRQHAKLTIYKCTLCDKSFSDSSNFSKHKKIHSVDYHQCDLCQRKFNSKKMIALHMDKHRYMKPVKCRHCCKSFFFKSMLNKHVRSIHSREDKYRCRFCGNLSCTLKDKWEHEWQEHKYRKLQVDCSVCGAQYRKYSELKRHCLDEHRLDLSSRNRRPRRRNYPLISYDLNFDEY